MEAQAHHRSTSPNKRALRPELDVVLEDALIGKRRSRHLVRQGLPVLFVLSTMMVLLFTAVLQSPRHAPHAPISGKSPRYVVASILNRSPASKSLGRHVRRAVETVETAIGAVELSADDDDGPEQEVNKQDDQREQGGDKQIDDSNDDDQEGAGLVETEGEKEEEAPEAAVKAPEAEAQPVALIFTMDSLAGYEEKSKLGGPAGEITIRRSLEAGLRELGFDLHVARSDQEFDALAMEKYNLIILDAWTWAGPGWKAKAPLLGHEDRIFLLDFFGAPHPRNQGIEVPPERILTAFDTTPWNTFLGYVMDTNHSWAAGMRKKQQGVLWGKNPKHYEGKEHVLKAVADMVELHSTLSAPVLKHPNIKYRGHLTPEEWRDLLRESRFLLGLGDPLLGPSAMDAIAAGCMYINPVYENPVRDIYTSQHPHAEDRVGPPHVCSAKLSDVQATKHCISRALKEDLKPLVPPELTKPFYMARIRGIFGPYLQRKS